VVNNIYAPSYKIAKFLSKWLTETLELPNTYVSYNSTQLAHEFNNLKINVSTRLTTFDIKDLYVNIPIKETIRTTKTLLSRKNVDYITAQQTCLLLNTILKQNYFQFDNKF
jgi:hypothetical protein